MQLEVATKWETYHYCNITIDKYVVDNTNCISIISSAEGPIATITVCIPSEKLKENESVIDTNNCEWAEDLIKKFKLGHFTGRYVHSGFCEYPVVQWDMDELKKYTFEYKP